MHQHPELMALKINSEVSDAKAVQNAPAASKLAEVTEIRPDVLLRQTRKLTENLQLKFLRHPRHFGGADRSENNLERSHTFYDVILTTRRMKTTLCRLKFRLQA